MTVHHWCSSFSFIDTLINILYRVFQLFQGVRITKLRFDWVDEKFGRADPHFCSDQPKNYENWGNQIFGQHYIKMGLKQQFIFFSCLSFAWSSWKLLNLKFTGYLMIWPRVHLGFVLALVRWLVLSCMGILWWSDHQILSSESSKDRNSHSFNPVLRSKMRVHRTKILLRLNQITVCLFQPLGKVGSA